ncbi:nucleolar pre-ribosomal-associated protein 1-like [Acridotheres tristis]
MVRELVHSFLMDLCCSLKHGITFCDPSLGTSGKGGNVVLLHFLLGLRPATEDQVVADLLICEAQPDISKSCKTSEFIPLPGLLSVAMVTTDVLDMVDVLIEDSDGFDEEGGFSLNEDVIISLQCCCPCCIRSQE